MHGPRARGTRELAVGFLARKGEPLGLFADFPPLGAEAMSRRFPLLRVGGSGRPQVQSHFLLSQILLPMNLSSRLPHSGRLGERPLRHSLAEVPLVRLQRKVRISLGVAPTAQLPQFLDP